MMMIPAYTRAVFCRTRRIGGITNYFMVLYNGFNFFYKFTGGLKLSFRFLNGYDIEVPIVGLFAVEFRSLQPLTRILANLAALDEILIEQGNDPGMFGAVEALHSEQRPGGREYGII